MSVVMQETIKDILRGKNKQSTLRNYEFVLIINPDYSMSQVLEVFKRIEAEVQESNGSFSEPEYWGFRTLAYPINKRNKAHYIYSIATLDPAIVKDLERFIALELHVGVFRHLMLQSEDGTLGVEHTMLRQSSLMDAVNGGAQNVASAAA